MDIFCKIAKKLEKSHIIFEDKDMMAILDIQPFSNGHTLIIPKEHYQLENLPPITLEKIIALAQKIAQAIQAIYHYDGIALASHSGKLADFPHFHLHICGKNLKQPKPEDYPRDPLEKTQSLLSQKIGK